MGEIIKFDPKLEPRETSVEEALRFYIKRSLEEEFGTPLPRRQHQLARFVVRRIHGIAGPLTQDPADVKALEISMRRGHYHTTEIDWVLSKATELYPGWLQAQRTAALVVTALTNPQPIPGMG